MRIEPISEIEYRVGVINSIKKTNKNLREASKPCTFLLQYMGTYKTLMSSGGFSEEEAKTIEKNYHTLYAESNKWIEDKIKEATKKGFVIGAFGLRIRTPILEQTVLTSSRVLSIAKAEARTAGNAIQQSWCMLNNRALSEFMCRVRNSEYALRIRPCALIHDALYFLVDNDPEVIAWVNKYLVQAIEWNRDSSIYDSKVKLEGEYSLFVPDWDNELTLPNNITKDELCNLVEHYEENL